MCEALNVHGRPTTRFHWSATEVHPMDDLLQPQHELYLVFHTHEHSVSGNRPMAIGLLFPTPLPHEYTIQWVASPMNYSVANISGVGMSKRGHVSVHVQYSAGIGCVPPPTKQPWLHGGAIQTRYICRNVTVPENTTDDRKSYEIFRIMNIQPFHPSVPSQKLSSYDLVMAYGDSILEQLVASRKCQNEPDDPINSGHVCCACTKVHFLAKVAKPLNSLNLSLLLNELNVLLQPHRTRMQETSTALILNSALWDVLSDEATMVDSACTVKDKGHTVWKGHLATMAQYLRTIAQLYPQVTLFWMLPTAVHIHRVHLLSEPLLLQKAPQKIRRTKYMSASRTQQLYQLQKDLLVSLRESEDSISVIGLDIYDATYLSADWTLPGDGRHYRPELNQLMLSWLS